VLRFFALLYRSDARVSADDRAVIDGDDHGDFRTRRCTVSPKDEFNRRARNTAVLSVALLAALIFGIIVLVGGDWIPGALIVAASLIGLARQIPIISKLCNHTPPSAPHTYSTPPPHLRRRRATHSTPRLRRRPVRNR
jgi:hypothetical protein